MSAFTKSLQLFLLSIIIVSVSTNDVFEQYPKLKQIPDQKALAGLLDNLEPIRTWLNESYISTAILEKQTKASVECGVCRTAMAVGLSIVRYPDFQLEPIKELLVTVCELVLVPPKLLPPDMCDGIINVFGDHLVEIVQYNKELTPLEICRTIIGPSSNCDDNGEQKEYIKLNIPGNKPNPPSLPYLPVDTISVKILHITDIHPDLHYTVGSDANCDDYMCCRADNPAPGSPEDEAGPYGEYKCDMPEQSMHELVVNAANRYEYDFVIMTGDLVHHAIWATTQEDNIRHYDSFTNKLLDSVRAGVPIYPVIGNHEPHPCNMFVPSSHWDKPAFNLSWMYESLSSPYKDILPADALLSYQTRGFYSTLHKDTNLRILAINSNLGYNLNFWLLSNLTDQEGQLQWLADELAQSEIKKERVYIIGHVPAGSVSTWPPWNKAFNQIILRFEHIIMGQFYGHTHNDEIKIFFDPKDGRPVNSLYIGASATPHHNLNPGYKVFYADGARGSDSTWELMDHETWIYNLSLANSDGSPAYYKLYSAREEYGLRSLRPNDLYDFVLRMLFDGTLFSKYRNAFYKDSHLVGECTSISCKLYLLCEAVKADSGDYSPCDRLEEILFIGTRPPVESTTTTEVDDGSTASNGMDTTTEINDGSTASNGLDTTTEINDGSTASNGMDTTTEINDGSMTSNGLDTTTEINDGSTASNGMDTTTEINDGSTASNGLDTTTEINDGSTASNGLDTTTSGDEETTKNSAQRCLQSFLVMLAFVTLFI